MDNFQLRFAGTGGQGMMLIGDLMAYYYGIVADKQIVLLKSYGPEARGGACHTRSAPPASAKRPKWTALRSRSTPTAV